MKTLEFINRKIVSLDVEITTLNNYKINTGNEYFHILKMKSMIQLKAELRAYVELKEKIEAREIE